jgi:hypothetical protein
MIARPRVGRNPVVACNLLSKWWQPHTPSATRDEYVLDGEERLARFQGEMMEDVMAKVIEFYVPGWPTKVSCAVGNYGKLIESPSRKGHEPSLESVQPQKVSAVAISPVAVNFANGEHRNII